jgi:hypothetical protein
MPASLDRSRLAHANRDAALERIRQAAALSWSQVRLVQVGPEHPDACTQDNMI